MINKRLGGLMTAAACVALTLAMPMARAQMAPTPLTPMDTPPTTAAPAPMMEPAPPLPTPLNPPQTASVPPVVVISNGPQVSPGDNSANWSPQRNVVESNQYERLLRTNPAFKQARIRKECGPITEQGLYQQCVASFD